MYGPKLRDDFLRRFTYSCYNEDTKKDEYYFKSIPSRVINDVATIEGMWTDDDCPNFLLEDGFTRRDFMC